MPDFAAIGTALAARFASSAMTAPSGHRAVRVSTTALPNQIPSLPAVLVFLESGDFDTGNGSRAGTSSWKVRLYYDQTGDLTRAQTSAIAWLTVMVDQLKGAAQLGGTALVQRATVDAWTVGVFQYGGLPYLGVELSVSIVTREGWGATA